MVGKNKKEELQKENNDIKRELSDVKNHYANRLEEYKSLEDQHKDCEKLKKQKNNKIASNGMFQCVQCEKEYSEEWKLKSHMKQTHRYKCDQCEKMFNYQDIMKKHILIPHENAKLYCHFYNNKKTCPYNDECVFLHEHSRLCKYGSYCEREYCMFKHECQNKEIETVNVAEEIIEIADDKNGVLDKADAISVIVDVDVHENIIDCDSIEIDEKR